MSWLKWLAVVLIVFAAGLFSWLNFTFAGRLIGANHAVATPQVLTATPRSSASDLSRLDVDFASAPSVPEGLTELMPELSRSAQVVDGRLTLRGVPAKAGWYSDRSGPFFYRVVSGNFLVETEVRSVKADDGRTRPTGSFNSSGLLIRDPASDKGKMRWVMYNIGQQYEFFGTEAKSTVPDIGGWHFQRLAGFQSASTLWLTPLPTDVVEARLRICRVGDEFRFFKNLPGTQVWAEEAFADGTTVMGNGVSQPTKGVVDGGVIRFLRPDIPDTVQVGLVTNPGMPPHDGVGQFASITFTRIADFAPCMAN